MGVRQGKANAASTKAGTAKKRIPPGPAIPAGAKTTQRPGDDRLVETAATSEEALVNWNSEPYWSVNFSIKRSRLYHSRMCSRYRFISTFILVSNSVVSTSASIILFGGTTSPAAKFLVGAVAVLSSINAVLKLSVKAAHHEKLYALFTELIAQIEEKPANRANLLKVKAARTRIEKDEKPVKRLVDLWANNEVIMSEGLDRKHIVPLTKSQIYFGPFLTFGMDYLDRWRTALNDNSPSPKRWRERLFEMAKR